MRKLTLYHGTKVENVPSIAANGLQLSSSSQQITPESGRLGPGIYLTDDIAVARSVSSHRGKGTGQVVFVVEVTCDSVAQLGTANDHAASWASGGRKVACATHPAWTGVHDRPFTEYVVRDPALCKIVRLEIVHGVVNGPINNPGMDIRVQGNVTFTGDVHCGTLTIG